MKVIFKCGADQSDIYEVDNDCDEDDLLDMACEWAADNVPWWYEIIKEDDE